MRQRGRLGPRRLQRRDLQPPRAAPRAGGAPATASRSRCDTEVLVHGYEQWGATACVDAPAGMFAFAIWDARSARAAASPATASASSRSTTPSSTACLLFASEIKAILAYPGVPREVDRTALRQYLTFRYVPSPLTMFKGIAKLPAGHFLELRVDGSKTHDHACSTGTSSFQRHDVSFEEALEEGRPPPRKRRRFAPHVRCPAGRQLSGGVDRSLIVAHMERLRQRATARTGKGPHFLHRFRRRRSFQSCPTPARSPSNTAPNTTRSSSASTIS